MNIGGKYISMAQMIVTFDVHSALVTFATLFTTLIAIILAGFWTAEVLFLSMFQILDGVTAVKSRTSL